MLKGGGFSFMRLLSNAIPNAALDSRNDVDLSPAQADNLLRHQLALPQPRYLDAQAFLMAGIAQSPSNSTKVHKALLKAGIVLPAPMSSTDAAAGSQQQPEQHMTVRTAAIGKGFASQLAIISVHAQRKLVGLLFFWEEECTRWKLLDEEEAEIQAVLEEDEGNVDLQSALRAVRMKKQMLPSQRREGTANVGGRARDEELPSYQKGGV